ncbi:ribosomal protein L23 [Thermoproteus uzoniensis 768-20]|uniref:Large ribosomal subunit protein uL23 n=1 Tax=Thermoproteus uzoniensis (strain 768-20) TaxID=999630 RepID=F2L3J1_THEU7|nr:50S ribosomal protein L23 [Thermoproteus uzoniensis]AEA13230.1 ribosomal protein L23 [Thermoproteus uzoniensis 768-20]
MSSPIRRFVLTEKALMLAERENKITLIVDRSATKKTIKDEVERLYGVKVSYVNTMITPRGEKKAVVKLAPEHNAFDLLSRLGLL